MSSRQHWQTIYQDRDAMTVSWFRAHLDSSLEEIAWAVAAQSLRTQTARILDAGGGASTLVDDLIAADYQAVTVVDLAQSALEVARRRLGAVAETVRWICGDLLTETKLPAQVNIWHDRAVFHFLCEPEQRAQYVDRVQRTLAPGGHLIVATFGPEGPQRCSGLPTMRYSSKQLAAEIGDGFTMLRSRVDIHRTPTGTEQQFLLGHFRRAV